MGTKPPLLAVRDLTVRFHTKAGIVSAVEQVDLEVGAGETVALVGESGCGKSTVGKSLVGLVQPAGGSIRLEGSELVGLSRRAMRTHRPKIQMIFQDPHASLNPRLTIGRIVEEPLFVHRIGARAERARRVAELLRQVGLDPQVAGRYPHEFSGGQRQRIGIARALALNPRIIVADEPVSALDVSVQGQVMNLLGDLQVAHGLAYLFISHDLALVQHIADRIAVMYLGRLVEVADRASFWSMPLHPYSRGLLDAIPAAGNGRRGAGALMMGEIPSATNPPSGCRFRTRCSFATAQCAAEVPVLKTLPSGRRVACHHVAAAPDGAVSYPGDASPDRETAAGLSRTKREMLLDAARRVP
jgi:oligopeptide/dipeptide ABC transporter ATP-binding protein